MQVCGNRKYYSIHVESFKDSRPVQAPVCQLAGTKNGCEHSPIQTHEPHCDFGFSGFFWGGQSIFCNLVIQLSRMDFVDDDILL